MSGLKKWLKAEVDFNLGDIVYQRVAAEKCKGMVTGICIRPHGVVYYVTWDEGFQEGTHFGIELTSEFIKEFDTDG